jgi:hypothetical protein
LTIPVNAHGLEFSAYVDLVSVRVGRAVTFFQFIDTGSPFDETLVRGLTKAVVARLNVSG